MPVTGRIGFGENISRMKMGHQFGTNLEPMNLVRDFLYF